MLDTGIMPEPDSGRQMIPGHSRLAITLEIYTHEDRQAHRDALGRISEALGYVGELRTGPVGDVGGELLRCAYLRR